MPCHQGNTMQTNTHLTSKIQIKTVSRTVAALTLGAALFGATSAMAESSPSFSELSALWWKWALETPASKNPLSDATGKYASVNQPLEDIFFLAGNQGGTTTRTITIHEGKALFFPIANVFDVEDGYALPSGDLVFSVPHPLQVARDLVSTDIATVSGMVCTVDAKNIAITSKNFEQSVPFILLEPSDNILGVPAGIYFPAVDAGYYLLLKPLTKGNHIIHFASSNAAFGTTTDVTYNITVK